jgi:FlaA1/EpsC-like NDP-sugar epimerase
VFLPLLLIVVSGKAVFFYFASIYKIIVQHFAIAEALKITAISLFTNIVFITLIASQINLSLLAILFIFVGELFLLISTRLARRLIYTYLTYRKADHQHDLRTLVIGAGAAGKLMMDEFRTNNNLHAKTV